jgi:hypothetical protein
VTTSSGIILQPSGAEITLLRHLCAGAVASTTIAACASAPATGSASKPSGSLGVSGYPGIQHWTVTLSPTRSYNSTAVSTQRQNVYGRVELTSSADNPTLTDVKLVVSVPNQPGLDVAGWGLSTGRCGSGDPPVLPAGAFPPIQLSQNGRGTADTMIPFIIPETGTYHVNVFRGSGTQLSDVLTCGELRRDDR